MKFDVKTGPIRVIRVTLEGVISCDKMLGLEEPYSKKFYIKIVLWLTYDWF